ncbi:MAG: VWA domain-containing protein [Deltaproteobacteria bacterium]|nr:VWA domain-containing protein [Deltaproteobacteria bacterium]
MARRTSLVWAYLLLFVLGGIVAGVLWFELEQVAAREPLAWRKPYAAWLGAGCLLLVWVLFHLRASRHAAMYYSRTAELRGRRVGWVARLASLPSVLRILAIGLLALALARPQTYRTESLEVEGIDIMVVLDLSRSMEERDLRRNRLDAGQRTIRRFIRGRQNDRIGLVVFAREAMMRCPLTLDYAALDSIVTGLAIGDVPEMGTAIGDALGLSLASLQRSDADSKVVVLISDGESNIAQELDPLEAKRAAMLMGVRVFTVLMGSKGAGRDPTAKEYAVNPELLREIARDTGGNFFEAGDDEALDAAFKQVRSTLDKSRRRIAGKRPDQELFFWFAGLAFLLLFLELLMNMTRWRRFP